jgi:ankyrin repeat protein
MDQPQIFKLIDEIDINDNNMKIIDHVTRYPSDLNFIYNGMSVFSYAASLNIHCLKVIYNAFLRIKGKNVSDSYNLKGKNGYAPIHFVTEFNLISALKYLIYDIEVDINSVNDDGNTALHLACLYNHMEIFDLLIQSKNIDLNINNINNKTPLVLCIDYNRIDMAKKLLYKNADLKYEIKNGRFYKKFDVVKYVMMNGSLEMKQLFNTMLRTLKNKIKNLKQQKQQKDIYNNYFRYYKKLCRDLSGIPEEDLYIIAHNLDIKMNDLSKKEICKQIGERLYLKKLTSII